MKIDIADIAEMDSEHVLLKYGNIDKEDALLDLHNICQAIKKDTNVDMERIKKLVRNKYDKNCLADIAGAYDRIFIINIDGKENILSCANMYAVAKATLSINKTIFTLDSLFIYGNDDTEFLLEIEVGRDYSNTLINNIHSQMWLNNKDPLIINLKVIGGFGEQTRLLIISVETLDNTKADELVRVPIIGIEIKKKGENDGE